VPLELLANVKKVFDKRMEEATDTTTSSCVNYEFYFFISIVAYICILNACACASYLWVTLTLVYKMNKVDIF